MSTIEGLHRDILHEIKKIKSKRIHYGSNKLISQSPNQKAKFSQLAL